MSNNTPRGEVRKASKDVADAVYGAIYSASRARGARNAVGYTDAFGEQVLVRRKSMRRRVSEIARQLVSLLSGPRLGGRDRVGKT